jgi:predicted RNA binding protein YcfA (HicA-like mRNA interferase family)
MAQSSREVIKLLESNGWVLSHVRGSHHYYKKDGFSRPITVPHPKKDLPSGTYHAILKQAGLE